MDGKESQVGERESQKHLSLDLNNFSREVGIIFARYTYFLGPTCRLLFAFVPSLSEFRWLFIHKRRGIRPGETMHISLGSSLFCWQ